MEIHNRSSRASRRGRLMCVLAVTGVTFVVAMVRAAGPWLFALAPPCPFRQFTGLYCAGCGMTRAFHHLVCGDPLAAVGSNPMLLAALPLLALAVLEPCTHGTLRAGLRRGLRSPVVGWTLAVVTILFAVLRNLPLALFRWLAP